MLLKPDLRQRDAPLKQRAALVEERGLSTLNAQLEVGRNPLSVEGELYVCRDNVYKIPNHKGGVDVKGAHLLLCPARRLAQNRQLHISAAQPISGCAAGRSTMAAFAPEVRRELGVCGIATIPNQVHYLVSYSAIAFNVLLMGRSVLGAW